MSEENVENVCPMENSRAFNRGHFTEGTDDLYALLDPDVEWVPGESRPSLRDGATTATRGGAGSGFETT